MGKRLGRLPVIGDLGGRDRGCGDGLDSVGVLGNVGVGRGLGGQDHVSGGDALLGSSAALRADT